MNFRRIGVIGGGQLAGMMAQEAKGLGLELIVQTPNSEDVAASLASQVILAEINDVSATAKLSQCCDVITFENEFIDLDGLQALARQGVCFRPALSALSLLLDKYDQRGYLEKIGLPTPAFRLLESFSAEELEKIAYPFVLKARRHGYDGYGTFIVKSQEQLKEIFQKIPIESLMWEEFVNFKQELAMMVARSVTGKTVVYPVVETHQKNQVCHWVMIPANLSADLWQEIENIAIYLVNKLEIIGILGIELFLTQDNRILVNEIAPRTHNSGHYTLDACKTSQFAMQLQAVAGLDLGSPQLTVKGAVMVNLLGFESSDSDYSAKRQQLNQIPHSFLHWYDKTESRPGRKLGHITVLIDNNEHFQTKAQTIVQLIEEIWYSAY